MATSSTFPNRKLRWRKWQRKRRTKQTPGETEHLKNNFDHIMADFPFCHNSARPSTEEEESPANKPKAAAAKKKFVPKVCISILHF